MSEPKILELGKIVETENGSYIKFVNGTLIQFGEKNLGNVNVNTDFYGSCKRGPEGQELGEFPISFAEKPNVNIRVQSLPLWFVQQSWNDNTTNLPKITLVAPNGLSTMVQNVLISWFAIGKWK